MSSRLTALLATVTLIAVWGALMSRFGGANVYAVMGPYAACVIAVCPVLAKLQGRVQRKWLATTAREALLGAVLGVAMTLATYPAFRLATALFPRLETRVESLYAAASTHSLAVALAWTLLIIVAEEVLWRGLVLDLLDERLPRGASSALSVLSYALAQLGSGSFIVLLLALVLGAIWTWQRRATGSIVAPLLAHLIWSPSVILLWPVT
jgi:membrane protease YdiL (CAAX protease family)